MNPPPPSTSRAPKLRAIQRAFATGIMRTLAPGDGSQPKWPDGRSARAVVDQFIKPNDRLSSFDRLEIYNRQYWYRLISCFYDDFPGLRGLIGERRFRQLTIAYLDRYPSRSYTLRDLGNRLVKFVRESPEYVAPHEKLAYDVVRLEWAHIVAYDDMGRPPLGADDLLDSDPATMRLTLQPYLTLLACDYPVDNYLLAMKRRVEPKGEASNAMSESGPAIELNKVAKPRPGKIWLAVQRVDHDVYYKRLEPGAYAILAALRRGATLQAACEKALRGKSVAPDIGEKLQGWFAQWMAFGWFCRAE